MTSLDKAAMKFRERKELVKSYLGRKVIIKIDRPIGYIHKKESFCLTYPINYGYIPGVIGGDGEELDVYLLGVDEPVCEYEAQIIGIAHREDDVEDKLVASPIGKVFYQNEIAEAIHFQEKYYKTKIEALYEKSAGAVVYTVIDNTVKFLLIKSQNGDIGFPKGHIEQGEDEKSAALREIYEETSITARLFEGFKEQIEYVMPSGKTKRVVYFVAEYENQAPSHNEGFENNEYMLLDYTEALSALSFDNAKEVLDRANKYINELYTQKESFLPCYCGHDCARCVTYIATQRNDDNLRKQSQRFYREEFGLDIPLEKFNCEGGRGENVFELCKCCPFIKCCNKHGVYSCRECSEYPCKELSEYQAKYVNKCNQTKR